MEFNLKKIFWAVLLSSNGAVPAKKFQEFVHRSFTDRFLALSELKVTIEEINVELAAREAAEEIAEGPDGYYIRLKPEYAELVRTYKGEPKPQKMTAASLETLSIIAYRQPITRGQIEAIRGVACDGPIGKLLELELISGKQNETLPGRPTEFSTTDKFLQMSGIKSLDELPRSDESEDERLREFFKKSEKTSKDEEEVAEVAVEKTEV
jgi:segregation and condensation protein B